jgi:tripartite ATP-independent transporter DctM subunit
MEPVIGVVFLIIMLGLIAVGIPIAFAMLATASAGLLVMGGLAYPETQLVLNLWDRSTDFVLTALPLYLLMGELVFRTRMAADLYECVYKWLGWLPGGLAVTSIVAAAGFGAVSGGGAVAVATLAPMCMPEMRRYGYSDRLSTGTVAVGGTLGVLIPPSLFVVVYGIWTETSIGALFIAGIIPGLIMTAAYAATILLMCLRRPELGPPGPRFPLDERLASLGKLLPTLSIFLLVIGGIYLGVFDPSEAAAAGVGGVFVIALAMRRLTWSALGEALRNTIHTSAMIFLIIFAGHMMGRFVVLTNLTDAIVHGIESLAIPPLVMIALFTVMYIILGMVLDVWAMLILTIPIVFPVVIHLGFDPIWFGIFVVVMIELALVTPPVGVNIYVLAKVVPDIPLMDIFRGVTPFVFAALAVLALLCVFPGIVTWLPSRLY